MRVSILASGSGGNACVVESGKTRVLVDAGLSAKEIDKRLAARGIASETIRAIFITHEHGDHSVGALTFAFIDQNEAMKWAAEYYDIIKSDDCVPVGHTVAISS